MPCSSQDIFAWTGAILINIGFIFGITWGSFTVWYFGAALTAIYAALLFAGARLLERRQQSPSADDTNNDQASTSSTVGGGGTTLLISLLYGQAILAVGVAGFFIPVNVVGRGCGPFNSGGYYDPYSYESWVANTTGITSPSVLAWMEAIEDEPWDNRGVISSFVYLSGINTTVFSGVSSLDATDVEPEDDAVYTYAEPDILYISANGAAPERNDAFYFPYAMVAVSDSLACFRAEQQSDMNSQPLDVLGCYDGETVQGYPVPDSMLEIREVRVFEDDAEGVVWYFGPPRDGNGVIFASVDLNSNVTTFHSVATNVIEENDDDFYAGDDQDYDRDCSSSTTRLQALCLLFASAIPVFIASIFLWRSKGISSTGLTSLVGLVAAYSMLVTVISPTTYLFDSHAHAIGWLVFGAFYCLAYFPVAVFDQATPPLRWGAATAAVSYLTGLCSILFFLNYDITIFHWIVFLVAGSFPLTLLGLVSDGWLITLLGAGVALASTIRLCVSLGDSLSGGNGFFLVVFISLAITGLLVGGLGYVLGKYKKAIKQGMTSLFSPLEDRVKAFMGSTQPDADPQATEVAEKEESAPVAGIEKDFDDVEF